MNQVADFQWCHVTSTQWNSEMGETLSSNLLRIINTKSSWTICWLLFWFKTTNLKWTARFLRFHAWSCASQLWCFFIPCRALEENMFVHVKNSHLVFLSFLFPLRILGPWIQWTPPKQLQSFTGHGPQRCPLRRRPACVDMCCVTQDGKVWSWDVTCLDICGITWKILQWQSICSTKPLH